MVCAPCALLGVREPPLLYALFAALGLWLASRTRELALGLMVLLGAVVVWSLLGKVLPPLYDDYGRVARLRGPVGLWNQLALLGDFALALALWHKRRVGTLLAYGWLVALALTYSRGGLATAVSSSPRGSCSRTSGSRARRRWSPPRCRLPSWSGSPSCCPASRADGERSSTRWRDGLIFGGLVLAGALVAAALARAPRPRDTPALRRALRRGCDRARRDRRRRRLRRRLVHELEPGRERLRPLHERRLELPLGVVAAGLAGWAGHRLAGIGAGSFHVTNLSYRGSFLDETTEPHSLPLQFLSEAGLVGLRCCSPRSSRSCARGGAGAATSSRWRCSCPRSSSIR